MIDDSLTLDNMNIPNCYGNCRNYVYYMFNHTVDLKCIFYPPNTHLKLHPNTPNKEEGIPTSIVMEFPKKEGTEKCHPMCPATIHPVLPSNGCEKG